MNVALINLISDQLIPNVLVFNKFNPVEMYCLHSKSERYQKILRDFKEYAVHHAKSIGNRVVIIPREVDEFNPESSLQTCVEVIEDCKRKGIDTVIINVTGGTKLMSFGAFQAGIKMKTPVIYVNTHRDEFTHLNPESIGCSEEKGLPRLFVQDFVDIYGAKIRTEQTELVTSEEVDWMPFVEYVLKHLPEWNKTAEYLEKALKGKVKLGRVVGRLNLKRNKNKLLDLTIMKKLAETKLIGNLSLEGENVSFTINHGKIKWFVKSGTPLELYIFSQIKSLQFIDDIKLGVKFFWDKTNKEVNNELDVMFSYKSQLWCISCKSGNLENECLNELEAYANRIGGTFVKKILVVTVANLKQKEVFIGRAKQMDIILLVLEDIIFDSTLLTNTITEGS